MKRTILLLIVSIFLFGTISFANAGEQLMVYTSMKESLIGSLRDAFIKKHSDVAFDYYSAGAGKLMAKIAAERQSGKMTVDVLWHSEVPDFYKLKQDGLLEKYVSPEAKNVKSPVKDPDNYFIPARLATLGIAYNTRKLFVGSAMSGRIVPPKGWNDLLEPRFKGGFGIANPAISGTAFVSVAMMVNTLGWQYIEKLAQNGTIMGQGSGQVVDDTASGDLMACLAVDFITIDKIKKGAYLGLMFPQEFPVMPSPIAIMKGTPNRKAAEKFIDFLLSKEGQTILMGSGTLSIRSDVPMPPGIGLVPADEAVERAMKIDYIKAMNEKEEIIKKFTALIRAKK
jgi:iron(III) transport system substrate-binding protein